MFYHPETQTKIPEGTAFELSGTQYPQNWLNLSSSQDKIDHGIFELIIDTEPTFDASIQMCLYGPIENIDGTWHQTQQVIDLPLEVITNKQIQNAQNMQSAILQGMTELFDRTAQERNYDNRITCALRAGYPGPFNAEGVAFATWMDTQNAKAYTLLSQVGAGTMPMPSSVAEALALLDPMVWPV